MTSHSSLESVLTQLSFFDRLRPDEISRVARHFEIKKVAPQESLSLDATPEAQRFLVVVEGRLGLVVEARKRTLRSELIPGDRHGDLALMSGVARRATLTGIEPSTLALLGRKELDAVLAEFPAVALPLAEDLARELYFVNDMVRQLHEVWAEGLSPDQHAAALEERRGSLERRGARVTRLSTKALFRRAVVEPGAEPPFWAMLGFLASLAGARVVVALILKYHLEKQLFALVPGADPNPMHVHHFNYGLILVGAAGLAALFPLGRKALRTLAFVFGVGAGLIFDEFALFWNLNPDYGQAMSLYSAGIAFVALLNLAFFRQFWVALGRRLVLRVRGGR